MRSASAERPGWTLKQQATTKLLAGVTSLDVCAAVPHDYCASAGTRLHVYDGATSAIKRQFTRFKDRAYGGSFRADGRLVVAGGEDAVVQVFDAASRTLLRQFKGHKAPVHVARFAAEQLHVITGSDDGLVALWDITSGQQLCTLRGHTDYVRAAAVNPAHPDVWATCGYDHICKLWDVRQKRCVAGVDHGAPIESVAFFPSGSLLVTAGGTDVCVWHTLGSGRLVQRTAAHQKTTTSVLVASLAGSVPHVVSAGLDGHVKVFDADTHRPTTVHKYPAPVLSLASSPAASLLVVGMSDGVLSIHRTRQRSGQAVVEPARLRWRPVRAAGARLQYAAPKGLQGVRPGDATVRAQPRAAVARHQELLLKFRFTEALEAALATRRSEILEAVVEAVARQGALGPTLSAAPPGLAAALLQHCRRQLGRPRQAAAAIALGELLLGCCPAAVGERGTAHGQLDRLRGRWRRSCARRSGSWLCAVWWLHFAADLQALSTNFREGC